MFADKETEYPISNKERSMMKGRQFELQEQRERDE
jgi:hypothetical protein